MYFKKCFIVTFLFTFACINPSHGMDKEDEKKVFAYTQTQVTKIVVETAKAAYKKINTNWTYGESRDINVNVHNWHLSFSPHNVNFIYNSNSKDNSIAKDLESLFNTPIKVECRIAVEAVRLACLIQLLGEDNVKKEIKKFHVMHFNDSFLSKRGEKKDINYNSLLKMEESDENDVVINEGDFAGILNISAYKVLKPQGSYSAHNVLCSDNDQFIGFHETFFKEPKSAIEIRRDFYERAISTDDLLSNMQEEHKNFITSRVKDFQSFENLLITERTTIDTPYYVQYFDATKINDFLKESTNHAS